MKPYPQAIVALAVVFFSLRALRNEPTPEPAPKSSAEYVTGSSVVADAMPVKTEVHDAADPMPELMMNAALVKDATGGIIYYRLNADERWPLASLTKLMTATVALENLPEDDMRDELIKRMMVISDNSAANALAAILGTEQWVALMTKTAARLGMASTGFADPSGLSYLNQSTADDISRLISYILQRHPEIFAWSRAKSVTVDGKILSNINEFAGRPDFLGGKTGFTDEASGNLVTLFRTSQGPVAMIVLGAPDKSERFIQTDKLSAWLSRRFKL